MLLARSEPAADIREYRDQIDRLANSPLLQSSEGLCRLLRFMAEHALNSPSEHLKEYQIATEALGRPTRFDPHSDASVRVQVGRLRDKLAEYYTSLGMQDAILVEIPKGRYTVSFEKRAVPRLSAPVVNLSQKPSPEPDSTRAPRRYWLVAASFLLGIVVASALLMAVYGRRPAETTAVSVNKSAQAEPAIQIFWSPFFRAPEEPFFVFKTLSLVGNYSTGMRRFDPSRDNPKAEMQQFTGVGEVMAVLELSELFDRFGAHFRAKREGLFTIDDARHTNLILEGPPGVSSNLNEIPGITEFTFRRRGSGPDPYLLDIIDHHPKAGQQSVYLGTSDSDPVNTDYAVVALKRGLDRTHWTLFLEGTSTMATQAAVDFVCNESSVKGLLDRLHIDGSSGVRPFEGLLRVKVANDVPVDSVLVDLRATSE